MSSYLRMGGRLPVRLENLHYHVHDSANFHERAIGGHQLAQDVKNFVLRATARKQKVYQPQPVLDEVRSSGNVTLHQPHPAEFSVDYHVWLEDQAVRPIC